MKPFVVGIDGPEASNVALAWARQLGAALESPVVPVHLESTEFDDNGPVGVALVRRASVEGALLLVVGQPTPGRRLRWSESAANYAAHHTDRPLAVVPAIAESRLPRRVLLAVDGSEGARAATDWLAESCTKLGLHVTAAVVPPACQVLGGLTSGSVREAEELLAKETAGLVARGVSVECKVINGTPVADALLNAARAVGADTIVAGTRRVGGLRPVRLGGVTMRLLRHAPLPVIVVPPRFED